MPNRQRHDPSKNLVGFIVGDVHYAVSIHRVREIANPLDLVQLPKAPKSVTGVADYRGEVVPVVDLRVRFGLEEQEVTRRTKWIIVDVDRRFVALVVDAVTEVFGTGGQELRPVPSLGGGDDLRGISGVTSHEGALTFVLETRKFGELTEALVASGGSEVVDTAGSGLDAAGGVARAHHAQAGADVTPARIAKLLEDPEPETRRLAAQKIAGVHGDEAAALLLRALGDTDWRVRKEATVAAASVEKREAALGALRTAIADKVNIGLRNAAVEAMVAIGTDALPSAIASLDALDEDGRKLAVEALAGIPDLRGTVALARALSDPDPNVRVAAAEALGRAAEAGEEARTMAIEALIELLSSDETMLKLAVLDSLTRLEAKLSWRTVEPFASDPILKRYALSAAAASREVDAIRALANAIGDASPIVAREAVIALGEAVLADPDDAKVVETASSTIAPLKRARETVRSMASREENPHARGAALAALGLIRDPNDVALLVDALSDPELADPAEVALRVFGEEALQPLMEAGRTGAPNVRGATLSLVPVLAPPEDETQVLAVMREALRDTSVDVLLAAMRVFARAGEASDLSAVAQFALHADARVADAADSALHELAMRFEPEARGLLAELDASRSEAVLGCIVVDGLARRGVATEADVAFLQGALSNGDSRARRHAVDALTSVAAAATEDGHGNARAADAVSFALADEEPEVVLAAVRALGRLRRPEPLVALLDASRDPATVAAALRALADADRDRALHVAIPLIRSADAGVASAAIEALGALSGPARDDALFAALDHADTEVVKLALSELGRTMGPRSLTRIGLALDHAARDVRRLAAELLGQDATSSTHGLLRARLEREKDVGVRVAIAAALSARSRGGGGAGGGEEAR